MCVLFEHEVILWFYSFVYIIFIRQRNVTYFMHLARRENKMSNRSSFKSTDRPIDSNNIRDNQARVLVNNIY